VTKTKSSEVMMPVICVSKIIGGNHCGTRNVRGQYSHPTIYTISHEEDELRVVVK